VIKIVSIFLAISKSGKLHRPGKNALEADFSTQRSATEAFSSG
jgi:hypothetical protein